MRGWLDSDGLRVVCYLVAAGAALLAGWREGRHDRETRNLWPAFWFLTAGVLLMMAIGRSADTGNWVAELGRRIAHSEGWYADRRKPQAIVVASIGATWLGVVVVSLWRVPERRRRYLPTAFAVFTLLCFAGIRLISLHQVDALLYRRDLAGVKVGAIIELALLLVTIAVTLWQPPPVTSSPARAGSALVDAS